MNKVGVFHYRSGFTIVELLIVIVVIAILAAITIVAFNGIQLRAQAAQYDSDANLIGKKAALFYTEYGTYPLSTNSFPTNPAEASALPPTIKVTFTSVGAASVQNVVQRGTADPGLTGSQLRVTYINTNTGVRTHVVRSCNGGTGFMIQYANPVDTSTSNEKRLLLGNTSPC